MGELRKFMIFLKESIVNDYQELRKMPIGLQLIIPIVFLMATSFYFSFSNPRSFFGVGWMIFWSTALITDLVAMEVHGAYLRWKINNMTPEELVEYIKSKE